MTSCIRGAGCLGRWWGGQSPACTCELWLWVFRHLFSRKYNVQTIRELLWKNNKQCPWLSAIPHQSAWSNIDLAGGCSFAVNQDSLELVFFASLFFSDCRTQEWDLEENPSSQKSHMLAFFFLLLFFSMFPLFCSPGGLLFCLLTFGEN